MWGGDPVRGGGGGPVRGVKGYVYEELKLLRKCKKKSWWGGGSNW